MKLQTVSSIVIVSTFAGFTFGDIKSAKTQQESQTSQYCIDSSFSVEGGLISKDPGSRINVRYKPNISAKANHFSSAGAPVIVNQRFENIDDGYCWYRVNFQSGAGGWVRGDFVDIYLDDL